jgi:hypothetical protein
MRRMFVYASCYVPQILDSRVCPFETSHIHQEDLNKPVVGEMNCQVLDNPLNIVTSICPVTRRLIVAVAMPYTETYLFNHVGSGHVEGQ